MGRAKTTACPKGHERTEENTYTNKRTGIRYCKVCSREGQKKSQAREKELQKRALEWVK